jgi:hypothetical protein
MNEHADIIDRRRSAHLSDVGAPDYDAATAIAPDGTEHLVLAKRSIIGDLSAGYDPTCEDVAHEGLGPLPLDVVRRIAVSQRTHPKEGKQQP